jgi:hypothetical protein
MSEPGRAAQDICSLGELIDMYYTYEATKRHDMVYALLGMSSEYDVLWVKLFYRLTKFLLRKKILVEIWGNKEIAAEIAVIKSKGCVLGKVSLVRSDISWNGGQYVDIIFNNIGIQSARWTLQSSAKSIQDGDLICLLQGASKPIIIRLCKDYFAIIVIAATLENT